STPAQPARRRRRVDSDNDSDSSESNDNSSPSSINCRSISSSSSSSRSLSVLYHLRLSLGRHLVPLRSFVRVWIADDIDLAIIVPDHTQVNSSFLTANKLQPLSLPAVSTDSDLVGITVHGCGYVGSSSPPSSFSSV